MPETQVPPISETGASIVNGFVDQLKAKDSIAQTRLNNLKKDPNLFTARVYVQMGLIDRIGSQDPKNKLNAQDLRFCLNLARDLEMDNMPNVKSFLDEVEQTLPRKRMSLTRRALLGGGALLGMAALSKNLPFQSDPTPTPEPKPTFTQAPTIPAIETAIPTVVAPTFPS